MNPKAKVKLSRQLGIPLTPKSERFLEKKGYPPGQHGRRGYGKMSDYKKQLYEKQRLKAQYNISEKQLVNYYKKATRKEGMTYENLIKMLETRLDALVLRGGLARTIYQARQLVAHGHILVNDRRVDIPSANVSQGQKISVKEKSRKLTAVKEAMEAAHTPDYLSLDPNNFSVALNYVPDRESIPVICEMSQVVEFYSR